MAEQTDTRNLSSVEAMLEQHAHLVLASAASYAAMRHAQTVHGANRDAEHASWDAIKDAVALALMQNLGGMEDGYKPAGTDRLLDLLRLTARPSHTPTQGGAE